MKNCRRLRGISLIEVSVAATLTITVMVGGLGVFLYGMSGFYKGQGRLDAQSGAQIAMRRVSYELREAMSATVDSDGMGVSYRKAAVDANGNITTPVTWDNISRRIALTNGQLQLTVGGNSRVIAYNVITTDPLNGDAAYVLFTPSTGTITRSINVMIAVQSSSTATGIVKSRARETIFLRNVPEITR